MITARFTALQLALTGLHRLKLCYGIDEVTSSSSSSSGGGEIVRDELLPFRHIRRGCGCHGVLSKVSRHLVKGYNHSVELERVNNVVSATVVAPWLP